MESIDNKLIHAICRIDLPAVRTICETEQHFINTKDQTGNTPLMRAARCRIPEDVILILIEKATIENLECDHPVSSGSTILHRLAGLMYTAAVGNVLNRTSRHVNKGDQNGQTPLHWCLQAWGSSYDARRETARCLLTYGASPSIKDLKGKTPLDLYDEKKKYSKYEAKEEELRELLDEPPVPAEKIARGEKADKAFKDATQNGEMTLVNARVMFLGKEGAGKTSCVKAMLGKAFNDTEQSTDGIVTTIFRTVGEDCSKWEEQKDVDVCEVTKQIHEHAISDNVAKKLTESQQKITLTSSTSSDPGQTSSSGSTASSTENLKEAQLHVSHVAGAVSMNRPISPANRFEKKLPDGIHKKVVDKLADQSPGASNFGPSEVTCIWDYAGQLINYITYRIFLTDGLSYSVVFSLLDDLDALAKPRDSQKVPFEMTNLQMNLFWIRSIYEHAVLPYSAKNRHLIKNKISSPPISLVATHKDQLSGSEEEKERQIEDKFNRIFKEITGTPYEKHVDREMYAVDNTAKLDEGIEKLKKNIGGYMKTMAKTVPVIWVDFQSKVQEVGKTRLCISLDEITKIATECGISKSKLIPALDYLNNAGIILYSKTNEKLKNTVITNLRMMIDILMKIIMVVKPDDVDKWPTLMYLWNRLDNEGILEERLLRHLWRHEIKKDASNFDIFLELMKMFGLLFEKQKGAQQGNKMFMVPSRMQTKKESLEVMKDEKQMVSVYVTPTDFLPDAVYNLLVVAFLDLMTVKGRSVDHVDLFQNRSDFDIDDDHVVSLGAVKIKNRHALKLEISCRIKVDEDGIEEAHEPHPSICIEVLNYLRQQLKTVYVTMEGVGYELRVLCSACEPIPRPHLHKLEDCLKNDSVPCGRKSLATNRINRHFSTGFDAKYTEETMNFLALQTLIVGRGTRELRRYFLEKTKLTKPQIKPFLTKERHGFLKDVDFGDQATKIFSADNIEAFSMSIMVTLIRYCCNNRNGEEFWENPPDDDKSELSNLVRIYRYKKTVLDCSLSNRVTHEEFENRWKDLMTIFTGVGVPVEDIENYHNPWKYKEGAAEGFGQIDIEEIRNFQCVLSVVVDVGTVTMWKYILEVTKLDKKAFGKYLMDKRKKGSFKKVRVTAEQKTKMFTLTADIKTFDISIMYLIIRNCCGIPDSFWKNPDRLTNLVHIHHYRNTKLAHSANCRMSTKDFENEWKKVRSMLHTAGASFNDIDKYKALRFTI